MEVGVIVIVMGFGCVGCFQFFGNGCTKRRQFGYGIFNAISGEDNTTQYPVNQRIVAGEPVGSLHFRASAIEQSNIKCKQSDMTGNNSDLKFNSLGDNVVNGTIN